MYFHHWAGTAIKTGQMTSPAELRAEKYQHDKIFEKQSAFWGKLHHLSKMQIYRKFKWMIQLEIVISQLHAWEGLSTKIGIVPILQFPPGPLPPHPIIKVMPFIGIGKVRIFMGQQLIPKLGSVSRYVHVMSCKHTEGMILLWQWKDNKTVFTFSVCLTKSKRFWQFYLERGSMRIQLRMNCSCHTSLS